jgi:hypothetical protein
MPMAAAPSVFPNASFRGTCRFSSPEAADDTNFWLWGYSQELLRLVPRPIRRLVAAFVQELVT